MRDFMPSNQAHWDKAYEGTDSTQLGWFQESHDVSLELIGKCVGNSIIDVGSGATTLLQDLIDKKYQVTALDISKVAIEKLKENYGNKINYIEGNLTDDLNLSGYEIWHDRAVLHFLLEQRERDAYLRNLNSAIKSGGYAVIETFSTDGAQMCCGLDLHTYDEQMLVDLLSNDWELLDSIRHIHINPRGGERPYVSTLFKKI